MIAIWLQSHEKRLCLIVEISINLQVAITKPQFPFQNVNISDTRIYYTLY